ncbi:hypothetical protein EOW65_11820 [Sinirhodobacter ferrireducens]|uniref:Uncharacterized protein n=1 Tax=Paenirhodobacter ferrireducens TaxID=1215032 RepID=A0A443LDP9_9RHOB|nr:hypothetical protein [Sinirhodobacter ferrireducens]RWR47301.1 hypothetical protein EOW65_11820 [Sinirhodobacter ferrireducens]
MERLRQAGINARGRIGWETDGIKARLAFEAAVLDARRSLAASFASIDPACPLLSARARLFGPSWADLLYHLLRRGVSVSIALDATEGAEAATALAAITQAAEAGGLAGRLTVTRLSHPAARAEGGCWPFGLFPRGHRQALALVDDRRLFLSAAPTGAQTGRRLFLSAEGPVVAEARRHLDGFAAFTAGVGPVPPAQRLLRTLSCPRPGLAGPIAPRRLANEVETAHSMLLRRAQRLVYLETQSFDCLGLARNFAQRAAAAPQLGLILILPETEPAGRSWLDRLRQRQALAILARAFAARLFVGLAPGGCANVTLFDEEAAIAGSADLSRRALRVETHAGLYLRRGDDVAGLRNALMRHWLPEAAGEGFFDPVRAVSAWRELAQENARTGVTGARVLLPDSRLRS